MPAEEADDDSPRDPPAYEQSMLVHSRGGGGGGRASRARLAAAVRSARAAAHRSALPLHQPHLSATQRSSTTGMPPHRRPAPTCLALTGTVKAPPARAPAKALPSRRLASRDGAADDSGDTRPAAHDQSEAPAAAN